MTYNVFSGTLNPTRSINHYVSIKAGPAAAFRSLRLVPSSCFDWHSKYRDMSIEESRVVKILILTADEYKPVFCIFKAAFSLPKCSETCRVKQQKSSTKWCSLFAKRRCRVEWSTVWYARWSSEWWRAMACPRLHTTGDIKLTKFQPV